MLRYLRIAVSVSLGVVFALWVWGYERSGELSTNEIVAMSMMPGLGGVLGFVLGCERFSLRTLMIAMALASAVMGITVMTR